MVLRWAEQKEIGCVLRKDCCYEHVVYMDGYSWIKNWSVIHMKESAKEKEVVKAKLRDFPLTKEQMITSGVAL